MVVASAAVAGEPTLFGRQFVSGTVVHPNVNCICRFDGQKYQIGDTTCIRGAVATCSTFLNNTSWTMSTSPCPMANYSPARLHVSG
jgi:hypothetical protein